MSYTERAYLTEGKELCDRLIDAGMSLLKKKAPFFEFQSTCLHAGLLYHDPFPTIHIHHTGEHHFVTSTSIGGRIRLYDSLNRSPSTELTKQLTALYSPDLSTVPSVIQVKLNSVQECISV